MTNLESAKTIFNILHDDFFSWTPEAVEAFNIAISALKFKDRYDQFWEEVKTAGMRGRRDGDTQQRKGIQNQRGGTMKPDEAIEILKNMKWSITTKFNAVNNSTRALDLAISALEKQEQDRWIPVTEKGESDGSI